MTEPQRDLLPAIEVDPSITDVDAVWDRFEIFEALHHTQTICNPMSSDELDETIDALGLVDGATVLDIACGPGELLMRAAARADIDGVGLDLSPWMLNAAVRRSAERQPDARLRWVLTEAKHWLVPEPVDALTCLGADWIWHGTAGTLAAMAERVRPGGRVAIGSPRLHFDGDPEAVSKEFGKVDTVADIDALVRSNGLEIVTRIHPDDAGWDRYMDRCEANATAWVERYPSERADRWLDEQQDWRDARERDRSLIGWSVWVAERVS